VLIFFGDLSRDNLFLKSKVVSFEAANTQATEKNIIYTLLEQ
jgi:hypothetical protein